MDEQANKPAIDDPVEADSSLGSPAAQPAAGGPEVVIEKLVYGGAGLARHEGRVVLVPFTLPGDRVVIEVDRERSGLWEAHATGWTERSASHTAPACPVFGQCGGCHYQHLPYEQQVAAKVDVLREVFRRIGKIEAPADIPAITGEPLHYRNRSQFHLDRARIGFQQMRSNRLVPVETCPISAPKINEALGNLRKLMHDPHWPRFLRALELFTNGERVLFNVRETDGNRGIARGFFSWVAKSVPGADEGALNYTAAGFSFRVSHGSFFQVNRCLVDPLVEAALGQAEGQAGLDLYAGAGLFSLPMTRRFSTVVAVETDGAAVRDLEANAASHGASITVHRLQAEQYLAGLDTAPDFVLADPPRSGLGKLAVQNLVRLQPSRITIVSCDPSTLARDLAALLAGGYQLRKLALIDLFPQTYHIETLAHLSR